MNGPLLSPPFTLPDHGTLAAVSPAKAITAGVGDIEGMAVFAMRLRSVRCGKCSAAHQICPDRYRFQMIRVHTSAIAAKVIQLKSDRNRAFRYFVGETMSKAILAVRDLQMERSVSRVKLTARPLPTISTLVNLGPEPVQVFGFHRASNVLESVA